jgi:YHS domain-containing protein
MEPVIICKCGRCEKQAIIFTNFEGEDYAFCSEEHRDKFLEEFQEEY